jgi:hypothetical protein
VSYAEAVGCNVDVDHRAGEDFRVVRLTPPGSACSISLMKNAEAAGSLQGLHLVVSNIDEARRALGAGNVTTGAVLHFHERTQVDGPDPDRADCGSFLSFSDPDGNGWLIEEVPDRTE